MPQDRKALSYKNLKILNKIRYKDTILIKSHISVWSRLIKKIWCDITTKFKNELQVEHNQILNGNKILKKLKI
jgi:hypothetical protein